jgi:limonene-1,2-epoxide hydrolase
VTSSDDIRTVEAFLDAMKAFDMERASALMADDIVYQNVPLPADRGVVLTERTDTLRGPLVDMEFWVCGTFVVRDGKIASWTDRFDLATVVGQMFLGPLRRLFRRKG